MVFVPGRLFTVSILNYIHFCSVIVKSRDDFFFVSLLDCRSGLFIYSMNVRSRFRSLVGVSDHFIPFTFVDLDFEFKIHNFGFFCSVGCGVRSSAF